MDPDKNLAEQRKIRQWLERYLAADDGNAVDPSGLRFGESAARLVELVEAMDEWMSRGGTLPSAWRRR